ncbi:MAG: GNAT family N-acetyltransferase [Lachnospiraceae bacterium]
MIELKEVRTEEEIQRTAALAKEIWQQHFTPIIGADQVAYMLDKFQSAKAMKRQIEQEGYTYLMAVEDGIPVGYTGFKREQERMFLSKLYVKKEYRKKGISRLMFEEIRKRSEGLKSIYLTVNKYNDQTIAIYHHMGFVQIDDVVTDIGSGFVMDDYILEFALRNN